jgi:hypothetical protein
MLRTLAVGVVSSSLLLSATGAMAQTDAPTSYTFVAQWNVPRAQWAAVAADFEKNTRPHLEKLAAAGTLVGWGFFETVVHTPEGFTHGTWWSSPTLAGIEQTRTELVKAGAASGALVSATSHRDYLLRTLVGNGKSSSGTGGYLSVSSQIVKAGKGQEWRQLWDKYTKPNLDSLVEQGFLAGYSLDVEHSHTENPGLRFIVTVAPNPEAEDKARAANQAALAKLSADERRSVGLQFEAVLEPGTHRDSTMRVIRYWNK